jgi:hypothetical protein
VNGTVGLTNPRRHGQKVNKTPPTAYTRIWVRHATRSRGSRWAAKVLLLGEENVVGQRCRKKYIQTHRPAISPPQKTHIPNDLAQKNAWPRSLVACQRGRSSVKEMCSNSVQRKVGGPHKSATRSPTQSNVTNAPTNNAEQNLGTPRYSISKRSPGGFLGTRSRCGEVVMLHCFGRIIGVAGLNYWGYCWE